MKTLVKFGAPTVRIFLCPQLFSGYHLATIKISSLAAQEYYMFNRFQIFSFVLKTNYMEISKQIFSLYNQCTLIHTFGLSKCEKLMLIFS